MAEEKNMTVATEEKTEATAPKTENQYLLKLNRPYVFEGKEYAEIDLAGLSGRCGDGCRGCGRGWRSGGRGRGGRFGPTRRYGHQGA